MGQCAVKSDRIVQDEGLMDPTVSGTKKALLVGINYVGTSSELRGCINDVHNQKTILMEHYGFQEHDITMLTEEAGYEKPTKARILQGFKELFKNAQPGDLLFFQYSGHGSQFMQWNGLADCICPLDCIGGSWPETVILDTEIHVMLYEPLPRGCKCVCVFDCCHSASVANLSVQRGLKPPKARYLPPPKDIKSEEPKAVGGIKGGVVAEKNAGHQLWVFSGCQDNQTSADAWIDNIPQGAFTWAFIKALKDDIWHETYIDLLDQIKSNLRGQYSQVPALTTTHAAYLSSWYCGKTPRRAVTRESPSGRKKALLIGINYRRTPNELRGCINDVNNQRSVLQSAYGYNAAEIMMLTEDEDRTDWPNKSRMVEGLNWLVQDARAGDQLFFQYSGHGSQMTDTTGREPTGLSDCICPLDCNKPWPEHIILDTEIHHLLYDQLPDGVQLTCVFDCCHSGTVANLDRKREISPLVGMSPESYLSSRWLPPPAKVAQPARGGVGIAGLSCSGSKQQQAPRDGSGFRRAVMDKGFANKSVWVYSGCQDDQTSADAYEDGQYQGAFTWAFIRALNHHSYAMHHMDLLKTVRNNLRHRYTQIPALSTTSRDYFSRFYLAQTDPVSIQGKHGNRVCF